MVNDVVPQILEMETSCSAYCSVVRPQFVREQMAPKILVKNCNTSAHTAWSLGPLSPGK